MADVVGSGPSSKVRATWWPNWVVSFGVARLGEASCAVTVLHASSLLVSGFVAESRPLWTRDDSDRFELLACCALCEWERSLQEKGGGDLQTDFRLRRHDRTYLWYDLRAHAAPSENARLLRCVGLLRDVTSIKRSQERVTAVSVTAWVRRPRSLPD